MTSETWETRGEKNVQLEVSNISANGLWVLCHDREYFLPYDQFPWFKDAPIKHIWLYRDEYAAVAGKCQLIRQRNLNRWKFLNP
jgi:hypothetical protein